MNLLSDSLVTITHVNLPIGGGSMAYRRNSVLKGCALSTFRCYEIFDSHEDIRSSDHDQPPSSFAVETSTGTFAAP